jgi:hypothetical protein
MKTLLFFILSVVSLSALADLRVNFISDGIRDAHRPWASEVQGMCHDENNYFIVQRYFLWKIPKSVAIQDVRRSNRWTGVFKVGIPENLIRENANHMGDCDAHNGLVLVPLEGSWPQRVLVYNSGSLQLQGAPILPLDQRDAPWLTFDPQDGSIIIGTFSYSANGDGFYRMVLSEDFQTLTPVGRFRIFDEGGNAKSFDRLQGGDIVRTRNILWIVSDLTSGGLLGFDLTSGRQVAHQRINFSPGFPKYEELEGVDALEDGEEQFPHYRGNLFVLMLDNELFKWDSAYLKLFEY